MRADGTRLILARHGGYSQPKLSPDGHTAAFIRDEKSDDVPNGRAGSLWIGDCRTGAAHQALPARFTGPEDGNSWITLDGPVFSPRGRYIYVSGFYGGDGGLIQRLEIRTGRHRFAFPGEMVGIFRNGPYRGKLLATRHTQIDDGKGMSYGGYPLYILRPNGDEVQRIAGSENWDPKNLPAWLKSKGWKVW